MPGCLAQSITDRDMVAYCFGDGVGEEPSGQIVPAFGQADLQVSPGTAVELRRSAGTRPAAPGRPAMFDLEQLILDELVQMELGGVVRHANPFRGLLAVDGTGLGHDVAI
jgi:hypothetical protein